MGYFWGFIGVLIFSITLPATRMTAGFLDPVFVGLGRGAVAGALAILLLLILRVPLPEPKLIPRLLIVALGVVIGFPLLSTYAMQIVPSSHGAVVVGILPMMTAIAGAWLAHEHHTRIFWAAGIIGMILVAGFSLWKGGWTLQTGDLFLFLSVIAAAVGYAEGGRLAKEHGGWKVISWALALSFPILLLPTLLSIKPDYYSVPVSAWAGFAYVSVFSMLLGFFAWYKGLSMSGIGKVGQVQLLQTFLTLFFSFLLVGEKLELSYFIVAATVVSIILIGRWEPKAKAELKK